MYDVQQREEVEDEITNFLMAKQIAFDVTYSPFCKEITRKVIDQLWFIHHGYNKLRMNLLDMGFSKWQGLIEDLKQAWVLLRCSIIICG